MFCPNEAPGLADCWGEDFEKLYTKYEKEVKISVLLRLIAHHLFDILKIIQH